VAYEIPKNLKYKEKIVFGLSFSQLFWLGLFGGLSAVVYLKTPLVFEVKVGLALVFCALGASFAFFGLFDRLKDLWAFKSSLRNAGYFDKRINGFVGVKKVEDDVVFLRDGSLCGVLQVLPIDFSMLSSQEQKAIVCAFRDFLNSLAFPVQIVIRTVNLSMDGYLAELEESVLGRKSKRLTSQFNSFKSFVNEFIECNCVKNRLFYVVIPLRAVKDKEKALSELNARIELCSGKLKKCNLLSKRLSSNELVSLLASFFNGFVEAGNDYFYPLTLFEEYSKQGGKNDYFGFFGLKNSTEVGL